MISTWQGALDALYGLTNWETRPPGTSPELRAGPHAPAADGLGEPQLRWRAVHVGGTNGKGSTCAMIAAGLRAARHKVGLFSSPHLHTVRERIQVDGRMIGEDEVIAWLNGHAALLASLEGLTTFEALTALAFDHFAASGGHRGDRGGPGRAAGHDERADGAGTLRDHAGGHGPCGGAGDTPAEIAGDKVGIFKRGRPVVAAPQLPEVMDVLREAAAQTPCQLLATETLARWDTARSTRVGQRFRLRLAALEVDGDAARESAGPARRPDADGAPAIAEAVRPTGSRAVVPSKPVKLPALELELELSLAGDFQRANAATAALALRVLGALGWRTDAAAMQAGLAAVRWPARLERFESSVVLGGPGPLLVIDGAHNPPAALALAQALAERYPRWRRHWIVGCSADKDIRGSWRSCWRMRPRSPASAPRIHGRFRHRPWRTWRGSSWRPCARRRT
ncbi:MAG: hypothetical protein IPL60_09600 [Ardenticatenia bacterium]|nr:hypothetical protein [Ardenticatenia bacterium]